jgi:hypothetical protein
MEVLEPRMLLSADLGYTPPDAAGMHFTLQATADGLNVKLFNGSTEVATKAFDAADGKINVDISRGLGGDLLYGDTITIDLKSLESLQPGTHPVTINITGGAQDLATDSVILSGTANLGYALTINSDADISVPATVNLTATDISLNVAMTDTGLATPLTTNDFFATATADLDVNGTLSAADVNLTATSTLTLDNSSLGIAGFQLAFILADSGADIEIGTGADLNATGDLTANATSNVSALATLKSNSASAGNTDAAVASVIITSNSEARITGSAQVDVSGALTLSAKTDSLAAAIADGSENGAGATLGLAVITGTTEAAVKDNASVTAGSISVSAERNNDATALAKSTPGGATTPSSQTDSQKALSDNKAQTSSGSVDLAGAVAVGTVVSHTSAFVDSTALVTSTAALDISAKSVTSSQTLADGSSTVADSSADSGSGNIGIAVGVGVGDLHNDAYAGGSGGIHTGSLSVQALMATQQRTLDFAGTDVNDAKDSVNVAGGAHGLKTGDALVYHQGTAPISGLTNGATYYAVLQDDGSVRLSSSADGASLITLGAGGSATGFSFTFSEDDSRLDVTAIAGASGGSTSIAGALALNVGISKASATVETGTIVTLSGGAVTIKSENFIQIDAKATGKQSSGTSTGVGAAFAINIGETDTDALVGDSAQLLSAGNVTLSAASKNDMVTDAEAGSAGKTAVTPSVAVSVVNNATNAKLGSGSLTLGGDLGVSASHQGSVDTAAAGDTESGQTGVGISLALGFVTDIAQATTARDIVAGGAVGFNARTVSGNKTKAKASVAGGQDDSSAQTAQQKSDGGVNSKVTEQKGFASTRSSDKGGKTAGDTSGSSAEAQGEDGSSQKVQVAGAVAVMVSNSTAHASIPDGRSITAGTAGSGGTVTVKSENNTDASAVADASTVMSRTFKFDPTGNVDTSSGVETIDLGADHGFKTGDKVMYHKDPAGTLIGGLSDGKSYYLNVTGSKVKLYDTADHASAGGATGLVDLTSDGSGANTSFEAGGGPTGTGVGIAVAVNVARVTNEALVGGSITADGLIVQALVPTIGDDKVDTFDAEATSGSSGADTGVAGALAVNVGLSHAQANIADGAAISITDSGNVALTAENFVTNTTKTSGKQDGGGKTGVGAAIGVNIGMTDTLAHVGDNASITNSKDITLSAASSNALSNSAAAGSAGKTAVTPSIAVSVSNNDTEATLGTFGSPMQNTGKVMLTASHKGSNSAEAAGDTESGDTGVGISLALTIATDKALATTYRDLVAGDAVTFEATSISVNRSHARASVAGAADENENTKQPADGGSGGKNIDQKVGAQKDGAKSKGNATESGAGDKTGDTSSASASTSGDSDSSSGSKVSVAGAVAVTVASNTSSAVLLSGRSVASHHSGQSGVLNLLSHNLTESTAFADGGATVPGGGTAVGAGVAVNVANVTNEARVEGGATVDADGLSVQATMAARDVKFTVDHFDVIDTTKDTIFVGLDSGLKTGDKRTYDNGGGSNTDIGGLSNNTEYYVRVVDGGKIQLYDSEDGAKNGDTAHLKDLTGPGTGTGHKLKDTALLLAADPVVIDPGSQVRVINFAEGSQLDSGDAVKYDADGGAPAMGGLNTNDTFYVINIDDKHSLLALSRDDAVKGKAIVLGNDGNTSQKLIDSTDTFRAEARSGAGGGKTGVAGSVGINYAKVQTLALVGQGGAGAAQVTLNGGDVDIVAASRTDNFVTAEPSSSSHGASGSNVGVGASFGLNIALDDTTAGILDGQTLSGTAGHFIVTADNQNAVMTTAENGASSPKTAIGAAIAIAVVDANTTAEVGSGSTLTLTGGEFRVEATHSEIVHSTTKGEAAGDSTAVGVSVTLNIVLDDTLASVKSSVSGAGLVTVAATQRMDTKAEARGSATGASSTKDGNSGGGSANQSRDSQQETNHQSDFATTKAGKSGSTDKPSSTAQSDGIASGDSSASGESGNSSQGGTSVAASVAVNYVNVSNTATVSGGASVAGSDHAKVTAFSDTDASAQGISTATNTKADTGVAAAVGLNIVLTHNTARVDNGASVTGKDVAIQAKMADDGTNTLVVRALSGGVAKNTAVGGSVAINVLEIDSEASVGNTAHVTALAGDIDIAAQSKNELQNVSGGAALSTSSGTGVGVAVSLNLILGLNTTAMVEHNAVLSSTGGSVSITANATVEPKAEDLPVIGTVKISSFAAGVAASSGGAAIGGSSSVDVMFIDTHAFVAHDASITAGQNITVSATDAITLFSAAGGIGASSGGAGVGIGLDVGVIVRHTTAHVDQGANLTATHGDISIHAQSNDNITSIAATFGLSTSSAGVAASVGVMVLETETRAYTEDGTNAVHLTATEGDVAVTAKGDLKALMIAGAVGASTSSAGVGVANTTLVHTDTVSARIGSYSVVNAAGSGGITDITPISGITVDAQSKEDIIALTAAGGIASSAGVAVAPTILVLSETTSGSVGNGATVNAQAAVPAVGNRNLAVTATDNTSIVSVAGSVGVGGTAGVAAGVDVLSLIKHTNAYMDSGVTSLVDGNIDVSATSTEGITSVAAGIAVGGTAGVSVNAGVHVLDITTRAFIGDDPDAASGGGAGNVHALGTVRIAADDNTELDKFVATVAVGGTAGVGAAATVTVENKHTLAFIGQGAAVTGDGQTSGLSANTGGFGVSFVPDAAKIKVSFQPSVNAANDTVSLGTSTGLVTGDYVTYHKGTGVSNTTIGGLEDGRNYYVRDTGGGNFAFYDTKQQAMDGTSPSLHSSFDPATKVDLVNETIDLGGATGLSNGDALIYGAGLDLLGVSNGVIGGLKDGQTYFVRDTGGGVCAVRHAGTCPGHGAYHRTRGSHQYWHGYRPHAQRWSCRSRRDRWSDHARP